MTYERRYEDTKKVNNRWQWPVIILLGATVISLLIVLIVMPRTPNDNGAKETDSNTETETVIEKNPDAIAIPGYEILELQADQKQQTLSLPNPPQNVCFFQISLYLEDGTLLWKSELVEPGAASQPILLQQVLAKGTYTNAVLKYDCFKMDGKTPLNGAETKLTLWVK